jgi:hypothetical protein
LPYDAMPDCRNALDERQRIVMCGAIEQDE